MAFTLIYCFSTLKNSITFLQGFNLLLGKGCSISLQLPLQLKSHLGLIGIFSVGTDGVGILSPSFLLLAAIWNKKNRTVGEIWSNVGPPKGSGIATNSKSCIFTVLQKYPQGNCQPSFNKRPRRQTLPDHHFFLSVFIKRRPIIQYRHL